MPFSRCSPAPFPLHSEDESIRIATAQELKETAMSINTRVTGLLMPIMLVAGLACRTCSGEVVPFPAAPSAGWESTHAWYYGELVIPEFKPVYELKPEPSQKQSVTSQIPLSSAFLYPGPYKTLLLLLLGMASFTIFRRRRYSLTVKPMSPTPTWEKSRKARIDPSKPATEQPFLFSSTRKGQQTSV